MAEWWAARTGISKHPKTYRLAEALGVEDAAGLGYMVALYDFAAAYRERGDLSGLSSREIARGCGWTGDPQAFVDALRSTGLLDESMIHDWLEIQGTSLDARDRARDRMRNHRSRNVTRTDTVTLREQYPERSEDLPTYLPTYLPTKQTKNVCAVTSPSDITPPPDSVIVFDCQGSPNRWHLTQTQIKTWQNIYPNLDVAAECHRARAWTDAGRRKTAAGMKRFLVGWLNRSTDKGGAKPNGFNPNDPTPLTPQREREIRIAKLREDLDGFRAMGVPTAIKQAEEALRKLGVNP